MPGMPGSLSGMPGGAMAGLPSSMGMYNIGGMPGMPGMGGMGGYAMNPGAAIQGGWPGTNVPQLQQHQQMFMQQTLQKQQLQQQQQQQQQAFQQQQQILQQQHFQQQRGVIPNMGHLPQQIQHQSRGMMAGPQGGMPYLPAQQQQSWVQPTQIYAQQQQPFGQPQNRSQVNQPPYHQPHNMQTMAPQIPKPLVLQSDLRYRISEAIFQAAIDLNAMLVHEWAVLVVSNQKKSLPADANPEKTFADRQARIVVIETALNGRVKALAAIADASSLSKNGIANVKKEDIRGCVDPRMLDADVQAAVWGSAANAELAAAALDALKPVPVAESTTQMDALNRLSRNIKKPTPAANANMQLVPAEGGGVNPIPVLPGNQRSTRAAVAQAAKFHGSVMLNMEHQQQMQTQMQTQPQQQMQMHQQPQLQQQQMHHQPQQQQMHHQPQQQQMHHQPQQQQMHQQPQQMQQQQMQQQQMQQQQLQQQQMQQQYQQQMHQQQQQQHALQQNAPPAPSPAQHEQAPSSGQ